MNSSDGRQGRNLQKNVEGLTSKFWQGKISSKLTGWKCGEFSTQFLLMNLNSIDSTHFRNQSLLISHGEFFFPNTWMVVLRISPHHFGETSKSSKQLRIWISCSHLFCAASMLIQTKKKSGTGIRKHDDEYLQKENVAKKKIFNMYM